MDDTKLCPRCNQVKPVDDFNFRKKSEGTRQVYCRDCSRAYIRDHYARNQGYYVEKGIRRNKRVLVQQRELIRAYLVAHPCVDCGEARIPCLEFDHVRGTKFKAIGDMVGDYPWATIEAEIAKCEVRCANCHRRKTAREQGWRLLFMQEAAKEGVKVK